MTTAVRACRDVFKKGGVVAGLLTAACTLAVCAALTGGLGASQGGADRSVNARIAALEATVKAQQSRLQTLEDVDRINKLTRAYGYYVDKGQWTNVAALWSDDGSVEIAARGIYLGRKGAERLFLNVFGKGKDGLAEGRLFNHMILQGIVDVDPGGTTAKGRWRAFVQLGQYQQSAIWSEGVYENEYVKEGEVWKFKKMRFWPTFYTPYDQGWGKQALPNNGPSEEFPPDLASTDVPPVFPGSFVPPYHYKNPVTGR
jgi:hypothetical protein